MISDFHDSIHCFITLYCKQVMPVLVPEEKMVYAVYISGVTTPRNVRGGARIDESAQISIIEYGGVFVVAMNTQNVLVRENGTVSLKNILIR